MQLVDQKERSSRDELEPVLYAALVDSMCQNFWPMFIGSVCTAVAAVRRIVQYFVPNDIR